MPDIEMHAQTHRTSELTEQLNILTNALQSEKDSRARAELALLIAQARRELTQEEEVRRRFEQSWWMSRTFEVVTGVAIASFLVGFFVIDNFLPLLEKETEKQRLDAEIALRKTLVVEYENEQIEQENERISLELERTRGELAVATDSLNQQLDQVALEAREQLEKRDQEIAILRDRGAQAEAQLASAQAQRSQIAGRIKFIGDARKQAGVIAQQLIVVDLVLLSFGDKKIQTIKAVRSITGLGLKESKELVESAPVILKTGISRKEAEDMAKRLRLAGAEVGIQ